MGKIFAIAATTFRECVRDRVFYVALLAFAGLMALSAWAPLFGLGRESAIMREMGLSTIAMGALFLLLVQGTGTVAAEWRAGTLQTVMSKPARRGELVLGKYCGIIAVLALAVAALTAAFLLILWAKEGRLPFGDAESFGPRALTAASLVFLELVLVASFVVFATLLTSRPAGAVIGFAAFTLGHLSEGAAAWLRGRGFAGDILAALTPRLEFFRVTQAAVDGTPHIGLNYILLGLAYSAAGAAIFLAASIMLVRRREIK